jgi:tRNA(Ile)-lysidine synthase
MDFHLNTHSQFVAKISAALSDLSLDIDLHGQPCIIASISGGPDSTAMLLACRLVSQQLGIELRACHVNHKTRGSESDLDEQFCRQLCAELLVPLEVYEETEARPKASESKLRATRYDFLFSCARSLGSTIILLAHTHNDQIETLLFRLFRGTSTTGLTGIKTARLMKNGVWLVRPMLNCSRQEVLGFLSSNRISARVDSSNQNDNFARNFLRNQVLPLCLSRFPSMPRQLERLREVVTQEDEFLHQCTLQICNQLGGLDARSWSRQEFQAVHMALQRRALGQAMEYRDIEVSFERVQAVLNMMADNVGNKRLTLHERWDLVVDTENIRWIDKSRDTSTRRLLQPVKIKLPGNTIILSLGKVIRVEEWEETLPAQFPHRTALSAIVDLTSIEPPLVLRSDHDTDKIRPLGMTQPVSLKKYLHSRKNKSDRVFEGVVLADQTEVLWVPGVGLSEKIKVKNVPTHRISVLDVATDCIVV